ncbi:hypothetical protein O4328_39520 [Rhodococcus opacus]|uniref:Uncharacterized protein n=1 Tax=Rhodococcus opacus TaxID=37919 RepID=A0ABT4NTB0_RHOOP|nr:hypothetical protein [Rhodococcus opacus]MCZ4589662.1 hypothetical protein [Rhodococcus opacus]CAG7636839.1 hypothetical protein E143388_07835 [Rhodococcus opacus]
MHVPYVDTRSCRTIATSRGTETKPTEQVSSPYTIEERLLDSLDSWMARHPVAANIVAALSVIAFIALVDVAILGSIA